MRGMNRNRNQNALAAKQVGNGQKNHEGGEKNKSMHVR